MRTPLEQYEYLIDKANQYATARSYNAARDYSEKAQLIVVAAARYALRYNGQQGTAKQHAALYATVSPEGIIRTAMARGFNLE